MLTTIKGEINSNTIVVGDFNTPLTPMVRSSRQKINKETQALSDRLDQLDLIDIYRAFYPKTLDFTFFSSAHEAFSRKDHILGHKFSSVQSLSHVWLFATHEPQHARPPCPSPTPGVHTNPCPLSQWCHPTIASLVTPFSSCPKSLPASGSFLMSRLFASGG